MSGEERYVKLEHGSGGALSRELIDTVVYPPFKSDAYAELSDAAGLQLSGDIFVTTDTYVVDPPFFPGGDIGKLSVFGTCNDLSVSGARPRYLTLGAVLEEGFALGDLRRVLESVALSAREAGVSIVSGDTKVVPRGKGGGIFLNTSGVGEREFPHRISPQKIRDGDTVLVSGNVGSHGLAVLAAREKLSAARDLASDCAFLHPLCASLFRLGGDLRFMRDPTRGGLAAILNETVGGMHFGMEVEESSIPISAEVETVSDILGINPLDVANEGVIVAVVAASKTEDALAGMRGRPEGRRAAAIGTITASHPGRVVLTTRIGGRRILDYPRGLLLPRIC